MTHDWRALTRQELDLAYDQRHHAANMQTILARLAQAGQEAHQRLPSRRLSYGASAIEMLDWYACGQAHAPLIFFIHGGAWKSGTARDYAFIVEWMLQAGWDVVIADFAAVTDADGDLQVLYRQLSQALNRVMQDTASHTQPIHLCGHSSGAHLAACLATQHPQQHLVRSLTACSGIYELEPVSLSSRSQYVKFTPESIQSLSPIRYAQSIQVPTRIVCGLKESPEFIRQARAFHDALRQHSGLSALTLSDNLNHFEILETLATAQGTLAQELMASVSQA